MLARAPGKTRPRAGVRPPPPDRAAHAASAEAPARASSSARARDADESARSSTSAQPPHVVAAANADCGGCFTGDARLARAWRARSRSQNCGGSSAHARPHAERVARRDAIGRAGVRARGRARSDGARLTSARAARNLRQRELAPSPAADSRETRWRRFDRCRRGPSSGRASAPRRRGISLAVGPRRCSSLSHRRALVARAQTRRGARRRPRRAASEHVVDRAALDQPAARDPAARARAPPSRRPAACRRPGGGARPARVAEAPHLLAHAGAVAPPAARPLLRHRWPRSASATARRRRRSSRVERESGVRLDAEADLDDEWTFVVARAARAALVSTSGQEPRPDGAHRALRRRLQPAARDALPPSSARRVWRSLRSYPVLVVVRHGGAGRA